MPLAVASAAPPQGAAWSGLDEHLLRRILEHLQPGDLAAAHLVARTWRDVTRLTARTLVLSNALPDTEQLKQVFPHVDSLTVARMELTPQSIACIAGVTKLTKLHLQSCRVQEASALVGLQALKLAELGLHEVQGPTAEQLDDAIGGLTGLHRLQIESRTARCRAPPLRSLAFLPRMRHLSVKQAWPQRELEGLTNLSSLLELEALDLSGASLTNNVVAHLSTLSHLTSLRLPEAHLVTDQGFQGLHALTALRELDVSCLRPQLDAPVTDAAVEHLGALQHLTRLNLAGRTAVTAHGLRFLGALEPLAYLNLTGARLGTGDPSYIWQLTNLTTLLLDDTQMLSQQLVGLSQLHELRELGASSTHFDDEACRQLQAARHLQRLNISSTNVTTEGVQLLNQSHKGRLQQLQIAGCRVSMLTALRTLRQQRRGVVIWDEKARGHLPRWINVLNALLMTTTPEGRRRLRLLYAPEANWRQQALMALTVAGLALGHLLLLILTTAVLLLMPLILLLVSTILVLLYAVGAVNPGTLALVAGTALAHLEVLLSGIIVGLFCVHVPPPPALLQF